MPSSGAQASRRYRGRPTDERREDRRRRLLDAALRLMARQGYPAVSVERICAAARVTTRHFYEHFGNREALLRALFDEFMDDARTAVANGLAAAAANPEERALNGLRSFTRFCLGEPRRARVAFIETVGVSPSLEQHRRAALAAFVELIAAAAQDLVRQHVLSPADYRLPALALVGATNELIVEWLSGRTKLSADAMQRQIVAIFAAIIEGGRQLALARRPA